MKLNPDRTDIAINDFLCVYLYETELKRKATEEEVGKENDGEQGGSRSRKGTFL
jgi:hypothetical protein